MTSDFFRPILLHYVDSSSMLQKFLGAVISEEWARGFEDIFKPSIPLVNSSTLAKEISQKTLAWLQGNPPPAYHEMAYSLSRIHTECTTLLQLFNTECKLPMSSIPFLGNDIDITGTRSNCFTVETAQQAVNAHFTRLRDSLGRTKKKEQAVISEKRSNVVASIERYLEVKAQYDIRVSATFAAAFVAFKDMPDKVSPVVKGIMNGIKARNFDLDIPKLSNSNFRAKKTLISSRDQQWRSLPLSNFARRTVLNNRQTRLSKICVRSFAKTRRRRRRLLSTVNTRMVFSPSSLPTFATRRTRKEGKSLLRRRIPPFLKRTRNLIYLDVGLALPSTNYPPSLHLSYSKLSLICGIPWQVAF